MSNPKLIRYPDHSMMTLTSEKVRYDLAESVGPDLLLSDVLSSSEIANLGNLSLEYRSAQGSPELRRAIAQHHSVAADQIVTCVGGMHAINLCSAILCNQHDHVLVQQPSFPLTTSALTFNNADVEFIRSTFDSGYQIEVDHLVSLLKPHTTLICLATPQNPSGVAIPQSDISKILDAMQHQCPDAFLLLDETYRQASYGDDKQICSLSSLNDRIVSCASLSKCHGAPGLRAGWVITKHDALRKQLINGKFQSIICSSGLDEAVALHVLKRSETLFQKRRDHLLKGRALVSQWVQKHPDQISWVPPDAGALCCVRLNTMAKDAKTLAQFHDELNQRSVRVAPGDWFGDSPEVFRLGFGLLPLNELTRALENISHVLKKLR